jgi:predicted GIY-YIG superfamily endonuclease
VHRRRIPSLPPLLRLAMTVYVYVLRSLTTGNFYVGISKTPTKRQRQHNRDQSKGTRGKGPWEEVLREPYADYATARKREKHLKSGQGRAWLRSAYGGQGSSSCA